MDLPDAPLFWHDRATDMHYILDHLDELEAAVPGLDAIAALERGDDPIAKIESK
jgi:predicted dienelactone hydrolase